MDPFRIASCALVLSATLLACSSGSTAGTGGDAGASSGGTSGGTSGGATSGGTSGGTSVARVIFDSTVTPGTHTAAECPKRETWLTIGSFGKPEIGEPARPVADGADDLGGTVSVSCSVKSSADGFDVAAQAQLTGAAGGAVTITGSFNMTRPQPTISLALTKQGETFSARDCVATFDASVGQGIAPGRVWGTVRCADATQPTAMQTCLTSALLRFENCTQ